MSQVKANLKDKFLLIGKVTKPHGLRGDVKIYCYSGQPENFKAYRRISLRDSKGKMAGDAAIANVRVQGNTAIVKIASVDNRNKAETLEGFEVYLLKEDLPKSDPGEFYWHQYTGRHVIERNGSTVGIVTKIFHSGAQDILVVNNGTNEVMIPVTEQIVIGEQDDNIIVDLPPGLLEINSDTTSE